MRKRIIIELTAEELVRAVTEHTAWDNSIDPGTYTGRVTLVYDNDDVISADVEFVPLRDI